MSYYGVDATSRPRVFDEACGLDLCMNWISKRTSRRLTSAPPFQEDTSIASISENKTLALKTMFPVSIYAVISPISKQTLAGYILATVIDLADKKLFGFAIKNHMRTDLIDAPVMAKTNRAKSEYVFHPSRGAKYTLAVFGKWREKNNVTQSMGKIETCSNDAVAEFFRELENRVLYPS